MLSYVQAIGRQYTQEQTFTKVERMGLQRANLPVEGRTRVWFNEELESKNYFIPGLVAVIMSIIGVLLTGQVIVREWERGTMELLISTPVRKGELIIGKLFPYFFLSLLDLTLALLMAKWLFDVPLRGSIALLVLLSSLYIPRCPGSGHDHFHGGQDPAFSQSDGDDHRISAHLPPLRGFTFSISNMPDWLQVMTYAIAPRYYVTILKEIFLKGAGFSFLWFETLTLVGFMVAGFWVATRSFKKELR